MFKKFCSIILITFFVFVSVISSFADTDKLDNDSIYNEGTKSTKEFLVNVNRPVGNESVFNKSYLLCLVYNDETTNIKNTKDIDDIEVKILIYNEDIESYVDFKDAKGKSSWKLGECGGIFIKEILLSDKHDNKIRIVAYKKSQINNLVLGSSLQVNNFTIKVLKEDFKEKIKNGFLKITEKIKEIFSIK